MLYDAETTCYSLGKSQMAFWGLLVLLSFTGIWILTGTMERIPPQVLILLGISGATGLSAVVIGNNKRAKIKTDLAKLQEEKRNLNAQLASASSSAELRQAAESRLATIDPDIKDLSDQMGACESRGFWRDIVTTATVRVSTASGCHLDTGSGGHVHSDCCENDVHA